MVSTKVGPDELEFQAALANQKTSFTAAKQDNGLQEKNGGGNACVVRGGRVQPKDP